MAGGSEAQEPQQRILTEAEAAQFRAVGRLNVAANRHCTATLIAPDLALTAAHCLFNALTDRRAPPEEMKFVIGQWREGYAALRSVVATSIPAQYRFSRELSRSAVANDVALLRLDAPVPPEVVAPIPPRESAAPGPFAIVSYGRDRAYAPSLREDCALIERDGPIIVLDCAVTFGVSGAPVLDRGGTEIVAVVSAMGKAASGTEFALAPLVAPLLSELERSLAAVPAEGLDSGAAGSQIRPVRRP